ncbi:hypothetical protein [Cypionkella sp. TWP1-2-1b2]|uniref:hypothetical protein n=1 Tax=Cypionkella sp. TWP1-2-1b2 TaxID=2804675 RepID=UPI003CECED08
MIGVVDLHLIGDLRVGQRRQHVAAAACFGGDALPAQARAGTGLRAKINVILAKLRRYNATVPSHNRWQRLTHSARAIWHRRFDPKDYGDARHHDDADLNALCDADDDL